MDEFQTGEPNKIESDWTEVLVWFQVCSSAIKFWRKGDMSCHANHIWDHLQLPSSSLEEIYLPLRTAVFATGSFVAIVRWQNTWRYTNIILTKCSLYRRYAIFAAANLGDFTQKFVSNATKTAAQNRKTTVDALDKHSTTVASKQLFVLICCTIWWDTCQTTSHERSAT